LRGVVEVDDGFIAVGAKSLSAISSVQAFITALDQQGNTLWEKTYGGGGKDFLHSVAQVQASGYVAVGESTSPIDGHVKAYLIRFDNNGDTLWTKKYSSGSFDIGYSVHQSADYGFVIAGSSADSTSSTGLDASLIKTDSSGNKMWQKKYGSNSDDFAYHAIKAHNEGIVLTGMTYSQNNGNFDFSIQKTDDQGNIKWSKTFGDQNWQSGRAASITRDGGYVFAGYTKQEGFNGSFYETYIDIYVIKTDSLGNTSALTDTCLLLPNTISIKETSENKKIAIEVFPNPTKNEATFALSNTAMDADLHFLLFNSTGKKVADKKIEGPIFSFTRTGEAPGVYYYRIIAERKAILTGKLVMQ